MINNQLNDHYFKKKKDPELEPFIIEKFMYFKIFSIMVLLPLVLSLIITIILLYNPGTLMFQLFIGINFVLFIISFLISITVYRELKTYEIKGSIVQDLSILLEKSIFKIRSMIFPILLFMILISFLIPGTTSSSSSSSTSTNSSSQTYGLILSFAGIIIPFIGLIAIASVFFDYIDFNNNRVSGLSEKVIPEEFRQEIRNIGKKIVTKDIKLRLGDIYQDDFSNHTWSVIKNSAILVVYSSITYQKATKEQNSILIIRELFRLKNRKQNKYFLVVFVRNLLHMLLFLLVGILIILLVKPEWNKWIQINSSTEMLYLFGSVVLLFLSSFLMKIYIDTQGLLNELKADKDTMLFGAQEQIPIDEIKRTLLHVSKLNPLIQETRGLNFRVNSLNQLFPEKAQEKKTGITWDDL